MMLSDVCLSVAYVGPKSRTERPRNTKTGTEVAHVTRGSDTTFKVTRPLCSPPCWRVRRLQRRRGNVLRCWPRETAAKMPSARRRARRFGAHGVRRGQARSYVQARGGSCLLVPRRLNFFETQINVMRNCKKNKIWKSRTNLLLLLYNPSAHRTPSAMILVQICLYCLNCTKFG